jgi:hypothetical protein
MEIAQNLLKADDVTFTGQQHIPLPPRLLVEDKSGGPGQSKQSAGTTPSPGRDGQAQAKLHAHIIEKAAEYSLIEITCPCGRKTLLKCEYAGT